MPASPASDSLNSFYGVQAMQVQNQGFQLPGSVLQVLNAVHVHKGCIQSVPASPASDGFHSLCGVQAVQVELFFQLSGSVLQVLDEVLNLNSVL